jgi:predicted ATP-dependent serine protease
VSGEVLLVGGKPGVGKTIACLQWARSMARQGVVAV